MNRKAIGQSALIIAAGLCACLFGPLQPTPVAAAPAASEAASQDAAAPVATKKTTRHQARTAKKKAAPAKPAPAADKPKDDSSLDGPKLGNSVTAPEVKVEQAQGDLQSKAESNLQGLENSGPTAKPMSSAALPASIANANAQLSTVAAADGAPPIAASQAAPPDQASGRPADNGNVVAPDEVNDLDRAVDGTAQPTVMAATPPTPDADASRTNTTTVGTAQVSSATSNDDAWDKASLIGKIFIAAGGLLTLASAARMFMA